MKLPVNSSAAFLLVVFAAACVSSARLSVINGTTYSTFCSGNAPAGEVISCKNYAAPLAVVLVSGSAEINRTISDEKGFYSLVAVAGNYTICLEGAQYSCRALALAEGEEKTVDLSTFPLPA